MAQQIEWTPQALQDFRAVIDYLESAWSDRIADAFMALTEDRLATLSQQPLIGIRSKKNPK